MPPPPAPLLSPLLHSGDMTAESSLGQEGTHPTHPGPVTNGQQGPCGAATPGIPGAKSSVARGRGRWDGFVFTGLRRSWKDARDTCHLCHHSHGYCFTGITTGDGVHRGGLWASVLGTEIALFFRAERLSLVLEVAYTYITHLCTMSQEKEEEGLKFKFSSLMKE